MREKEFWQNECKCGREMVISDVDMEKGIFWKSCPKYMDGDNNHDSFSASIIPDDDGDLYGDFYKALEIIAGSEFDYEGKGEDRDWLTNELLNVKSIGELEMNMARLNTNWKNFFVGENCKEFQKWYQEFVADGGNTLLELPLENSDDKFARKLGFTDYSELCEKSEIVHEEPGDITWYVTKLPDGRWAAWDDAEISLRRVAYFDSRDEAVAFQQSGMEIAEGE